MKKLFTILFFSAFALSINAQMTLEHTFTSVDKTLSHFKKSDGALMWYYKSFSNNVITIYNEDFTVYKVLDLTAHIGTWVNTETSNNLPNNKLIMSDKLFNEDVKLEFIVRVLDNKVPPLATANAYLIINEDGLIIQTINGNSGVGESSIKVYKDGVSNTLLELALGNSEVALYSLPGDLLTSTNYDLKMHENVASLYPNPAKNYIKLEYSIPGNLSVVSLKIYDMKGTVIKEMNVDGVAGFVLVDINDLQNGNYIMKTMNGDELLSNSQFVVMK
tara:strand:+ start:572 stop:1396 length:825 start_codon:yes stop_codon:yes gene_type:complete